MSNNNNPTETDLAIAAINNSISVINSLASKVHNIVYDSTLNKTKIYGHTNFEELNVLGSPVALASQIPDITGKANVSHTHKTDDITRDITTINEEEEEVTDEEEQELEDEEIEEDNFDDTDESDYDDETNEELKDLVVIDEDELELEQ